MRRLLSSCACALALAVAAPARANVGAPTSWFVPASAPYGVLAHRDGSIWVATAQGVQRFSRAGEPLGVVVPFACTSLAECANGDVVLVDHTARAIERRTAAGALVRRWPIADAARDGGRVVTDAADRVYVLFACASERGGMVVRRYEADGRATAQTAPLGAATAIARAGGTLFVADLAKGDVHRFSLDLAPAGKFTLAPGLANDLQADREGNLLLTERFATTLRRLSPDGQLIELVNDDRPGFPDDDQRWAPWGVSEAPDGLFVVTENSRGRVLLFGEQAARDRRAPRGAAGTAAL